MKKILSCLFLPYCVILAEILFVGRKPELSIPLREYFITHANVVPFRTIIRYAEFFLTRMDKESFFLALRNIGGNFLLFMPMGFFLSAFFSSEKRFGIVFLTVFLMVFTVEILQGIFRLGVPDVDDLIVNMMGACVGMLVSKKLKRTEYRSI
jgi:glycopeptide antibiotics resistance protein